MLVTRRTRRACYNCPRNYTVVEYLIEHNYACIEDKRSSTSLVQHNIVREDMCAKMFNHFIQFLSLHKISYNV